MRIGIVGFGPFGQFLAKTMVRQGHVVTAVSRTDHAQDAKAVGVEFIHNDAERFLDRPFDAVILSVSIIALEKFLRRLPLEKLKSTLVVDVLSVKTHPKQLLLHMLPESSDILCTHPMFGPDSGKHGWSGLSFVYDKVRIQNQARCEDFLRVFSGENCRMVEMSCEAHDQYAASSQFITHTTGRMLALLDLKPSPIGTRGYETLLDLMENTRHDHWDLYFGLFLHNPNARAELIKMEQALSKLKNQLLDEEQRHRPNAVIGVQGGPASFCHQAALELCQKHGLYHAELEYLITSRAVLSALHGGEIDYGVFAIENSASGTVIPSIYSMSKFPHDIVDIHNMKLTQCLLKHKGQDFTQARKIITHPQAVKQCRKTLTRDFPQLTWDGLSDEHDTAECARKLSEGKFPADTVVIASSMAADQYGLDTVRDRLNDDPDNFTSFILCKRPTV